MLPPYDEALLNERHPGWSVTEDGGMVCVILPALPLPTGFTVDTADLLLRLSPGYPDIAPDMWWFYPHVSRADGAEIPATQSLEPYLGRVWQRWSRHLQPDQWRAGIDSLESYLSLVRAELAAAAPKRLAA